MQQFYIFFDNNQIGPLSIDDLKNRKITQETLVWSEGMANWQKAVEIDEIQHLFVVMPPPIPEPFNNMPPSPRKVPIIVNGPGIKYLKFILVGILLAFGLYSFLSYMNVTSVEMNKQTVNLKNQEEETKNQTEREAELERIQQRRTAQEQKMATEKGINEIANE